MKKYLICYDRDITEVEVDVDNEHYLIYEGARWLKNKNGRAYHPYLPSDDNSIFDTRDQAIAFLLSRETAAIKQYQFYIKHRRERLEALRVKYNVLDCIL